jgi:hypothetical protein
MRGLAMGTYYDDEFLKRYLVRYNAGETNDTYPEFDINTLTLNAYDYDFLKLCKVKVD